MPISSEIGVEGDGSVIVEDNGEMETECSEKSPYELVSKEFDIAVVAFCKSALVESRLGGDETNVGTDKDLLIDKGVLEKDSAKV